MLKIIKINSDKEYDVYMDFLSGFKIVVQNDKMDETKRALNCWVNNPCGSDFRSQLFNLIAKADNQNLIKIMHGFPEEVVTYHLWQESGKEK